MSESLTDRVRASARERLAEFPIGSRFLGVAEVCADYEVSTATAVRALGRLADEEGLLERRHGVGYFVTAYPTDGDDALWELADAKLRFLEQTVTELRTIIDRLKEGR